MNAFAAARDGRGRKAFAVPTALSSDDAEWTALDKLSFARWLEAEGFRSPRLKWLVDYACRDDYGTTAEECRRGRASGTSPPGRTGRGSAARAS
ncbi:hypothetical protein ACN28S_00020 [Cystobacter fuscus]